MQTFNSNRLRHKFRDMMQEGIAPISDADFCLSILNKKNHKKMNTTNHTPGPWALLDREENSRKLTHITNGAHIVCTLGTTRTDGSPNHYTNANLIASAPDLLEALISLEKASRKVLDTSATHDGLENCKTLLMARIAIEKAQAEVNK